MKRILLLLILLVLISIDIVGQTIPKQINYQGILKDATGNLLTGDYALTFKIYNEPTGGAPLWTEIQVLPVTNGLFNAQLGDNTPINGVPFDRTHFLGIQVGTGIELTPRTMLTPTPYSFMTMNVLDSTVVKSLNGLKDDVNLVAGSNITIIPSGNDLTISAGGVSGIIGGSGTSNYLPLFTNSTTLGDSKLIQDASGNIQIGMDGTGGRLILSAINNTFGGGLIIWRGAVTYDDWVQDSYEYKMRFFTNSLSTNTFEIFNSGAGKVNLNVEGEIQTQQTGDANIAAFAYARVEYDGTIRTSGTTSNVTLLSHVTGSGKYEFNITGLDSYYSYNTVCIATLMWPHGEIAWSGSGASEYLGIHTFNIAGDPEDHGFTFIVYKK